MYIVVGQKDTCDNELADRAYGPFETFEEANAFVEKKVVAPENKTNDRFGLPIYTYYVLELMPGV